MVSFVPKHWKPILVLLILTPLLTELLTNNIPARKLLRPQTFLFFSTLVYGPVLLLRELAARWRSGFVGYLLLGLVYGLYNEGLLGQTIFHAQLPNPSFNNYGYLWGTSFTWAANIIVFHSFYAFIFPLVMVYYIFPSSATKPWINKGAWLTLSALCLIYISLTFLKNLQDHVTVSRYFILIILMTGLVVISNYCRDGRMFEQVKSKGWSICLFGFVFVFAAFTIPDVIARSRINPVMFVLYILAVFLVSILLLRKKNIDALLVFCLAAEISFSIACLLVAKVNSSRTGIETSSFFIAIFLIALILVLRKRRHNQLTQLKA
jgi:hypothetical protein